FTSDRLYSQPPIGVVMGLAWTSMGGSALYIESIVKDKATSNNDEFKGKIVVSGKLGQVMQESANLAYTYAIVYLSQNHPQNKFFKSAGIHLHVPEGATPKDGPSAGITMTTSLLSLALNKHVRSDVAMTGELTLTGKVLKIGGLKEKIIAARRSGIKRVIFPKDNLSDWLDLPQNITDGIEGCAVDYYSEVPPLVF
ncbi:Lon protease-like protein, partial [Zancudomyces culisetae]